MKNNVNKKETVSSAKKSKISWTESTWNPITGCTKISSGCKHCYAEKQAEWLKNFNNVRYQNGFQLTVHEDLIDRPLIIKKPSLIFVNSMSDVFHEDLSEDIILRIFETMNKASWHTFQVLTKRGDKMAQLSNKINWTDNIWMGVTVEDKSVLNRIDNLKSTGAKVKFISAEPLLESLGEVNLEGINWLIVGGESGSHARPMKKEWAYELKDIAEKQNVPFFFKQWGGRTRDKGGKLFDGEIIQNYPILKQEDAS
jgi:protein gp37